MNVALYARVSTEEQARHGISIDAQLDALRSWAKDGGHHIVGEYVDAGISGKKPYRKRPELLRFMQEIEKGLKADALVFCKLDRFFRSVKLYYQTVDILDRYHVAWQAIQEDYETVTASGRMKVNIMLAVAENEADRTAERIKAVFDHKVIMGEAISGALPLGLKIVDKHIVPDENADKALAVFEHYAAHGNKQAARDMLHDQYGISLPHLTITHMLQNSLYKGEYRGNKDYCPAIVPPELFDRVQDDLRRRSTRRTPSGRVYLFSGLVVCKECGRRMGIVTSGGTRTAYRCAGHYMRKECDHATFIRESAIEQYLLNVLSAHVASAEADIAPKAKKPPGNSAAVEGKLSRLKELYIDGDIPKEKYISERNRLTALLEAPKPAPPKRSTIVGKDFLPMYARMTREQKKTFWRDVIDHITVDNDKNVTVVFK